MTDTLKVYGLVPLPEAGNPGFLGAFYKGRAKKPFGTRYIKIANSANSTYLLTQILPTFYTEPTRLHPKTENPCF